MYFPQKMCYPRRTLPPHTAHKHLYANGFVLSIYITFIDSQFLLNESSFADLSIVVAK